ncbi:MAG: hypothetical protein WAP51_03745, partial [Candidatus Sungiibacteriota bacterium]
MSQDIEKKYISLREASTRIPYSQDYLRLLIRLGYLQGIKLGRNWFTTYSWIEEYLNKYSRKANNGKKAASEPADPTLKTIRRNSLRYFMTARSDKLSATRGRYQPSIAFISSYKYAALRIAVIFVGIAVVRIAVGSPQFLSFSRSVFDSVVYPIANTTKAFVKLADKSELIVSNVILESRIPTPREAALYALAHPPQLSPTEIMLAGFSSMEKDLFELTGENVIFMIGGMNELADSLTDMTLDAPFAFSRIAMAAIGGEQFLFDNLYYSVANSPAFIGKISDFLISAEAPPTPRQIIAGIREDLRDIFTNTTVPSPEPVITALKDIFDKAFAFRFPSLTKFFVLKQPQPVVKTPEAVPPQIPPEEIVATTTPPVAVAREKEITTQVREVVERREVVSTADVSVFHKKLDEINQYVLNQFSKVFTELTDLGAKVDTKTPFTVFAQSQKIDQLISPTIVSGMNISSGNLTSSGNFDFAGTGRVASNLSVGGLLSVSGSGTSTLSSNLSISGNLSIGGLCLNCGGVSSFAGWTQSGSNVFLTTPTNSAGLGTSTPGAKLSVTGSGIIQDTLIVGGTLKATSTALLATEGGSVGIGTTSPWGLTAIEHTTSNNPSFGAFVVSDEGTSTPSFIVLNQNGFVGVATRTPGTALGVNGAGSFVGSISTDNVLNVRGAATSTFLGGISIGTAGGLSTQSGLTVTGGSILASNIGATFGSTSV